MKGRPVYLRAHEGTVPLERDQKGHCALQNVILSHAASDHQLKRQSDEFYTSTERPGDCTQHKPSCETTTPGMGGLRLVILYTLVIA